MQSDTSGTKQSDTSETNQSDTSGTNDPELDKVIYSLTHELYRQLHINHWLLNGRMTVDI